MAGKADLIDAVAATTGLSKKQSGEVFEALFAHMTKALKKGDRVQIPGFGSFTVSKRASRTGRNPQTGATIRIRASKGVRFRVGSDLKVALNGKR